MSLAFVKPDWVGAIQLDQLSVNPRANESFTPELFEDVPEFAGLILDQRGQHYDFGASLVGQDLIDDLLGRLAVERSARLRIMRLTHRGKEDPQIIVDLSRGRDGRSRVRAGAALLDGNRGRQSFDEINVRLFHLI